MTYDEDQSVVIGCGCNCCPYPCVATGIVGKNGCWTVLSRISDTSFGNCEIDADP